ncbi:879_t:CDS:2 [Funneliformis geosporum]|uniref:879_t:CDS:1 n=1 Tax=Funneliformis geosporum TaxID=1117311 RepID=A0A9W4WM16_9GLOM|nr:879_t:CDS:2 [Funneliformis geosporum]
MYKILHSYNVLTSSEVAALMIEDGHEIEPLNRGILLKTREGGLQRISELHSSYDVLHYVLLFPKGDDDYKLGIYIILGMQKLHKWNHRKNATGVIGRLYMIQPIEGKRYYLRILLIHVTGATSFDNLKTVNKQICRTFKKACTYLGLLQNNNKWNKCLYEANLIENSGNANYMVSKAILTPKNINVEIISDIIMKRILGEDILYSSADLVNLPDDSTLKLGILIILLRKLNLSEGLCNGTRLIFRRFASRVIDAKIITGSYIGKRVFISRIILTSSETKLPFILNRCQFPIRIAFSMTINKSQEQTLNRIIVIIAKQKYCIS